MDLAIVALKMLLMTGALFAVVCSLGYCAILVLLGGNWKARLFGFVSLWLAAWIALWTDSPEGRAVVSSIRVFLGS